MDCSKVCLMLQDEIDGRLPPSESAEILRHLESCPSCGEEAAGYRRVGELLRLWTESEAGVKAARLDAMWTRVRAGVDERRQREEPVSWLRKWIWVPAGAVLAVLVLLFYPSDVSRAPFHPTSFDVAVEDLESEAATVALVDKGDDLPRVIWIIENDKT